MNKPIDRNSKNDLLKQIGRVEIELRELSKEQSKYQKEIDRVPKLITHLEYRKLKVQEKISKKKLYLNQLEKDLEI